MKCNMYGIDAARFSSTAAFITTCIARQNKKAHGAAGMRTEHKECRDCETGELIRQGKKQDLPDNVRLLDGKTRPQAVAQPRPPRPAEVRAKSKSNGPPEAKIMTASAPEPDTLLDPDFMAGDSLPELAEVLQGIGLSDRALTEADDAM